MRIFILITVLSSLLIACGISKNASSTPEVISILHGTSFGHCRGYCIKEAVFTNTSMRYTKYNRDSLNYPKQEIIESFTTEEYTTLLATIDWEKWEAMDTIIGCPDCTDAGAEYIKITTSKGSKRVKFDAYSNPEGLEKLLSECRAKRRKIDRAEQNKGEE